MFTPNSHQQTLAGLLILGYFAFATHARAQALQVEWITQYCNESIQTVDLSTSPRMLRNISNSLMTVAPDYLDGSIYLQRRTNFVDRCPELEGIGELSSEWLRSARVDLLKEAVVVAAVREDLFPGAATLLTDLGWTSLSETITLNYVAGAATLPLYAGLVPQGPVQLNGEEINGLKLATDPTTTSIYFFFLETSAFPADKLGELNNVGVPEPGPLALCLLGMTVGTVVVLQRKKLLQV